MNLDYFQRWVIIKSLKSDEKKIEFLEYAPDLFTEGDVIISLSNDEIKLKVLKDRLPYHYIRD